MRIRGGGGAPSRARRSVLSQLAGHIAPTTASDVAFIVSELVTSSVLHASVGPRQLLTLELITRDDGYESASSIQDHDSDPASSRLITKGSAVLGSSWCPRPSRATPQASDSCSTRLMRHRAPSIPVLRISRRAQRGSEREAKPTLQTRLHDNTMRTSLPGRT
jgi:hypothetical protein